MNIMVCAANPYSAIVFEFRTTKRKPLTVEVIDVFWCSTFVPIPFVYTYLFATVYADAAIAEKVRRVGKDGVDRIVLYLIQSLHAISVENGEVEIG